MGDGLDGGMGFKEERDGVRATRPVHPLMPCELQAVAFFEDFPGANRNEYRTALLEGMGASQKPSAASSASTREPYQQAEFGE